MAKCMHRKIIGFKTHKYEYRHVTERNFTKWNKHEQATD